MIKIRENTYCPLFEYMYLFVMVIYMAQMTPDTGRMVGTISGNPIPLLIPIILTIILYFRHPISFAHKRLWTLIGILFCWSFAICYKFYDFSTQNLSYYFFLFYAIIVAYIHIQVYGRDLFLIYEHIMVVLSLISLVLWGFAILLPFTSGFFHLFPDTTNGNNVMYLFHWMDPLKVPDVTYSLRNAGCSWEPGRFAIMLIPAIFINLSRRGVTFHKNKNAVILIMALASTFSTTGYSIAILLYAIYWFESISFKRILFFVFVVLPSCLYLFSLDFMGSKIQDRVNYESFDEKRIEAFDSYANQSREEYVGSLDRFESASFDWMNFQEEPLLGYGRNNQHSWFRQKVSNNYELTGGLVKTFSQYGVFVGLLLYVILFVSSFRISGLFPYQRKFAMAFALLLCSVSYVVFVNPVFTVFWLYGLLGGKSSDYCDCILIGN